MADVFDFYVHDDRRIDFRSLEPIMQEDKDVTVWRFRIPKVLNQVDMTNWAWWFVYTNARGQKFSKVLMLSDDIDEPGIYNSAEISIDHGISIYPGNITFALEAIEAVAGGGEIIGEWHTYTYTHKVVGTLQGNQAEFAETESDIISALIVEVQNKVNSLVGGATPQVVSSVSDMTDTSKIYVLSTDGNWYYYNDSTWQSGGQYASGIIIDPTLSESGQAADAKVVGENFSTFELLIGNTTYSYTKDKAYNNQSLPNANDSEGYECARIECKKDDVFFIKGAGGTYARLWILTDSENTILAQSVQNLVSSEYVKVTVTKDGYLYVNNIISSGTGGVFKSVSADARITGVESGLNEIKEIYGDNLCDLDMSTIGLSISSTGVESESAVYNATDYIYVDGDTLIKFLDYNNAPTYRICVYNSDKMFVRRNTGSVSSYPNGYRYTYSKNYVRIVYENSNNNNYVKSIYVGKYKETPVRTEHTAKDRIARANINEMLMPVPDYYKDHLSTKIQSIKSNMLNAGNNALNFVFITDEHWQNNAKSSPALIKQIKKETQISVLVNGGDVYTEADTKEEASGYIADFLSAIEQTGCRVFSTIGNHEYNNPNASTSESSTAKMLSDSEVYPFYLARQEMGVSVFNFDANGFPYYIDNKTQKVRTYFLPCHYGAGIYLAPIKWIMSDVASHLEDGWAFMIVSHVTFNENDTTSLIDRVSSVLGFMDAVKVKSSYTFDGITYDFTNKNLTPICIIGGHTHLDLSTYSSEGIPVIATTCDALYSKPALAREAGTVTEQAFDVVTVDKQSKSINCVRIGAGTDRQFTY